MKFLKKHFEKMILALLLSIFAVALIYLYNIIEAAGNITERDLQIPQPVNDYESVNVKDDENYAIAMWMTKPAIWQLSEPRNTSDKMAGEYSDLLKPPVMARCPHCQQFIPLVLFLNGEKCIFCREQEPLVKPTRDYSDLDIAIGADTDGDGLPNAFEIRNTMNPNDYTDGISDFDGDSFSNSYEYMMKTDMKDPKSHPPFWKRLYITGMKKSPLGVFLVSVMTGAEAEAELRVGGRTSRFKIGQELKVRGKKYRVSSIESETDEMGQAVGKVVLVSDDGSEAIVREGAEASIESKTEVMIADSSNLIPPKAYKVNDNITLGRSRRSNVRGEKADEATYVIKSIDAKNLRVVLEDKANPQDFISISRTCEIPERVWLNNFQYYQNRSNMSMDPMQQMMRGMGMGMMR